MTYNELRNQINKLTLPRANRPVMFFDSTLNEFREIKSFEPSATEINSTIKNKEKQIDNNNPFLF